MKMKTKFPEADRVFGKNRPGPNRKWQNLGKKYVVWWKIKKPKTKAKTKKKNKKKKKIIKYNVVV